MSSITLPRQFLRNCRRVGGRLKVADSLGTEMTGTQLLQRTLVLRRLLLRHVLAADEQYVGLLLPPSAAAAVANAALPLAKRIAVNLNYTMSPELINYCISQCGIRHVLTSRRMMEKLKLDLNAEIVYLEDFREKLGIVDKAAAFVQSILPVSLLERYLGIDRVGDDDLLTVLFTSGSTGQPKGVMLSHRNVASQIESIQAAVHLNDKDVAIGVMPFFHSYGYTATLWTVLCLTPMGAYHVDPRNAHQVGKLCAKYGVTVFMATPTFLRIYLRRVQAEDFRTLDSVFGAAEKLPKELADAFESKFSVRPYEAYGCTELSPLVAVNVPPHRNRNSAVPTARGIGRQADSWRAGQSGASGNRCGLADRRSRHAVGDRSERDEGISWNGGLDRESDSRRMVRDRRHRADRRRWVYSHHRSRQPVFKNRRRDGAPCQDRGIAGADYRRRRRSCSGRGYGGARFVSRRAVGGVAFAAGKDAGANRERACRRRIAEALDSLAG